MGAELPKEKVVATSGRGFQGSGQDFKLQAAQSLEFRAQTFKYIDGPAFGGTKSRLGGGLRRPPTLDFLYVSKSELEISSSGQLAA